MKKKTMHSINQSYMDLIDDGWLIHGICKKKEIDKTIGERKPDTRWFFALWPVKNYVIAWYKLSQSDRLNNAFNASYDSLNDY